MHTDRIQSLFQPFRLKSLTVKNRFVMAPMTRQFSPGGIPTADVVAYYRRRAKGEVGLILSEGTLIDRPASISHPDIPHFYGNDALAGWQRVIEGVHEAGGAMGPRMNCSAVMNEGISTWYPSGVFCFLIQCGFVRSEKVGFPSFAGLAGK